MPLPLKVGEVLRGRYKIRERIGAGGMGSIYLAEDLRLEGRRCALKEVEHDRTLGEKILSEAREQFLREATILARLDHPNLPKVSDFFNVGSKDYLVMDFVPGSDLRSLMLNAKQNNQFLQEIEVLKWASQICDALQYMHTQEPPIVHRDIKPSNLKLTPEGLIKLVDFGLVRVLAPDEVTITIIQGQGTALYTPLEQYGGADSHTDVRSDIFSLGSTLYHLLTNQSPAEARERFLDPENLALPRTINPGISVRTEKAVLWAMELHPDRRPDSVESFRQFIFGTKELPSRPHEIRSRSLTLLDALTTPPDSVLIWLSAGLLLLGLIATLGR